MAYFKKYPVVNYRFGDNEPSALFSNISAYVDIIDEIKNEIAFFEKYTIQDGDRPDIVSQKLYGTPDYHWTFWAMNHKLRESGWPMPEHELRALLKKRYPHRTVTTETSFAAKAFKPGAFVTGKVSGTTGTVIERNLDLGQITIKASRNSEGLQNNFGSSEQIVAGTTAEEQNANIIVAIKESAQFDAALYYKNSSGTIVDIDPADQTTSTAGLTPVTLLEDNVTYNDDLKNIVIIKPSSIKTVVNEYFKQLAV